MQSYFFIHFKCIYLFTFLWLRSKHLSKNFPCFLSTPRKVCARVQERRVPVLVYELTKGEVKLLIYQSLSGICFRVRSSVIWEELGVEPLPLQIERSPSRWHLTTMPPGCFLREVFSPYMSYQVEALSQTEDNPERLCLWASLVNEREVGHLCTDCCSRALTSTRLKICNYD